MALKKCRECGSRVSTRATTCPTCGAPVKRKSTTVSTGCGCLIILLFGVIFIGIFSNPSDTRRPAAYSEPTLTPEQQSQKDAEGKTAVDQPLTVTQSKIEAPESSEETARLPNENVIILKAIPIWFTIPRSEVRLQRVFVRWQNVGDVPIRAVDVTYKFYDREDRPLEAIDYTLYAVSDEQPGVQPGEVFTYGRSRGFTIPSGLLPATVEVEVTGVYEKGAF